MISKDFGADGFEYEYDINAKTGAIVKFDKERDDDYIHAPSSQPCSNTTDNNTTSSAQTYVGEASAKSAAYKHAGVKESDVYDYSCELDHEHKITVYEIEFKANGYEYDYEIDASTGSILKCEKEKD